MRWLARTWTLLPVGATSLSNRLFGNLLCRTALEILNTMADVNTIKSAAPASDAAPHFPQQVTGMYILAETLRRLGLMHVYGLVGIPVTEAAYAMQKVGINYYGFRFEQQAGMAAATHGYLTKQPGVLLTVSSLGMLNGLTATANATVNCYPMIQISGASDPDMVDMDMGTYEQLDQLNTARPLVKAAFRCSCQGYSKGGGTCLPCSCKRPPGRRVYRYDYPGSCRDNGCRRCGETVL